MAIDLIKRGQTVDLTKNHAGLQKITIGLSWGKTTSEGGGGLLGAIFNRRESSSGSMDIDSSVVVLDSTGRKLDLIYYGNKRGNGILHHGDDLTGNNKQGVYDNEEIDVDLNGLPSGVDKLVFVANIYAGESRNQHFGQVKGAYIRVLNASNREELIRYDLSDDYNGCRGLVVGELYRYQGEWKFRAIGQGTTDSNLQKIVNSVTR